MLERYTPFMLMVRKPAILGWFRREEVNMIGERHLIVLKKIYQGLRDTDIIWAITGSTAFALQGLPIVPNDIDIQTNKYGAYEIEKLFINNIRKRVKFCSTEKIRSHFGVVVIEGLKVEIMGDTEKYFDGKWEEPIELTKYRQFVKVNNIELPVLDLKYEYEAYLKMGRLERCRIMEEWLEK